MGLSLGVGDILKNGCLTCRFKVNVDLMGWGCFIGMAGCELKSGVLLKSADIKKGVPKYAFFKRE